MRRRDVVSWPGKVAPYPGRGQQGRRSTPTQWWDGVLTGQITANRALLWYFSDQRFNVRRRSDFVGFWRRESEHGQNNFECFPSKSSLYADFVAEFKFKQGLANRQATVLTLDPRWISRETLGTLSKSRRDKRLYSTRPFHTLRIYQRIKTVRHLLRLFLSWYIRYRLFCCLVAPSKSSCPRVHDSSTKTATRPSSSYGNQSSNRIIPVV